MGNSWRFWAYGKAGTGDGEGACRPFDLSFCAQCSPGPSLWHCRGPADGAPNDEVFTVGNYPGRRRRRQRRRRQAEGHGRRPAGRLPLAAEAPRPGHRLRPSEAAFGAQVVGLPRGRLGALGAQLLHPLHRQPRFLFPRRQRAHRAAAGRHPLHRGAGTRGHRRAGRAQCGRQRSTPAPPSARGRNLERARPRAHADAIQPAGAQEPGPRRHIEDGGRRPRRRRAHPRRRIRARPTSCSRSPIPIRRPSAST